MRGGRFRGLVLAAAMLAAGVTIASCSKSSPRDDVGAVGLALTLPGGATISTVSYQITGNGISPISGSIDVSAPGTTQATALVSSIHGIAGAFCPAECGF